jgi:acetyl-CoA carboxylase carboxyltransferase component
MTAKKVIRAQNIAIENRIPTVYLADSAGIFLPLQDDVFPDTDDFGRVFRNNAVMRAMGIPQITAIMGMCVAGGRVPAGDVRSHPNDRRQRSVGHLLM